MKTRIILKLIFLSLMLGSVTSCGYFEKWKNSEQPTDSNAQPSASNDTDDLFSKTLSETSEGNAGTDAANTDAPKNVIVENSDVKDDLKSLEEEFSDSAKTETAKPETAKDQLTNLKVEESIPVIREEIVQTESGFNPEAGKVVSYQVQKGETLMQIAFKIYGDISKWKHLKTMNSNKLSSNTVLRTGMELKYTAPEKVFVWSPEGNPHMIKTGETLGTISNTYFQTPKKWKQVWENNKPMIKNPNIIFAGFTLYVKGGSRMAQEEAAVDQTRDVSSAPERQGNDLEELQNELKEEVH